MGYDYSGYGASTGLPTVLNTFTDIEACLVWLLQQGKQPEDIILYGQSVGSGPTCHLAAKTPKLGGVVLHSPLATGESCPTRHPITVQRKHLAFAAVFSTISGSLILL